MKLTSLAAALMLPALMLPALTLPATIGCQGMSSSPPTTQEVVKSQVLLDTLPPAAKLAGLRESEGGVIKKVSKGEFEGHELFTVEFTTVDGSKGRLQTLSDGRILSKEIEQKKIAAAELPPEVMQGAMAHTGGVKPDSVLKAKWGITDVYVITASLSGRMHQFTFDARGQLLKEQAEIDPMQVPVRARATLFERFSDLKVTSASEIRISSAVFFEVIGETKDARLAVTLLPDGTVKSIRTE